MHGIDKHKRDLIVYLLWNKGLMTNEKSGQLFNMSYQTILDNRQEIEIKAHARALKSVYPGRIISLTLKDFM